MTSDQAELDRLAFRERLRAREKEARGKADALSLRRLGIRVTRPGFVYSEGVSDDALRQVEELADRLHGWVGLVRQVTADVPLAVQARMQAEAIIAHLRPVVEGREMDGTFPERLLAGARQRVFEYWLGLVGIAEQAEGPGHPVRRELPEYADLFRFLEADPPKPASVHHDPVVRRWFPRRRAIP
jgi:hypothetical protein